MIEMNVKVMVIELVKVMVIDMVKVMMIEMVIEVVNVKVMKTTCNMEAGKPGRPIEEDTFGDNDNDNDDDDDDDDDD